MLFLIAPSIFLTYYRTLFRRSRHDTRNSSPLDIFSPHSKFTAPQSPSHVNYPPGSRDGTIARSSKDYLFIQRDNHSRGDRSTRRVLNRRREEIRSNEKKWSRRRIVNTGANRLGTKKTYSSKDTRRVSKYSQRERSSLDEGEPFSLQTRARVLPILPSSRLLRFLQPPPLNEERSPFFSVALFLRLFLGSRILGSCVSLDLTIYKTRSRRCLSTVFTTDSRRLNERTKRRTGFQLNRE